MPDNVRTLCIAISFAMSFGFLPLTLGGCGPAPAPKFKVTGSVSLDGDPVEHGTLIFYPVDSGSDADVATITNGQYEFLAKPGLKRVEITGQREMVPEKLGPYGDPEVEQFIPPAFNRESKLEAEVAEAEINVLDFELETPAE